MPRWEGASHHQVSMGDSVAVLISENTTPGTAADMQGNILS